MANLPEPYPCWNSTSICPYSLRCREIDEAAELVTDPGVFAQLAVAYEQLSECHDPKVDFIFFKKPTARQKSEGICPAYAGHWNGSPRSSVACSLAELQLHDYCELKFCLSAVMLMVQPFSVWIQTGELNVVQVLAYRAAAFLLIFAGTEASEGLKRRWSDDADRDH